MFQDKVTIFCKAGNGGDGVVSFHREKYVPKGGPDGGDGGRGGSVYFMADSSKNTLIDFRYSQHFKAQDGDRGAEKNQVGKSAPDVVVKVPRGTVVKDAETGGIIADIFNEGEKVLILEGGKGGRGNARFASALRRAPSFSELGEKTIERKLILELKTIADVGLVGYPNVGKSTLLSVISAAKPKIANYHFTTLSPNLGVVEHYDDSFVVADIPGLIEGASDGVGLGHDFLRHIERVRVIVHVIDASGSEGRDPVEDYFNIRKELEKYSEKLASLPEIVVANKTDMMYDTENIQRLVDATGKEVIPISAITTNGVKAMIDQVAKLLATLPEPQPLEFEPFSYEKDDTNSVNIQKEDGVFYVTGGLIESFARKVVVSDHESFNWFQKVLRDKGVMKKLRQMGIKDGDTVAILDVEFEYFE